MKEQLNNVILSEAKNLNSGELTTRSLQPTLKMEDYIFMSEPGNGEGQSGNIKPDVKQIEAGSSAQQKESPFTRSPDQIKNQSFRDYAIDFQRRIKEKPLENWTKSELEDEYMQSAIKSNDIQKAASTDEKMEVITGSQAHRELLIGEYEKKGGDPFDLFQKTINVFESGGADTPSEINSSIKKSSEEKDKILKVGEKLMELGKTPEFEKQTQELADVTPEQEAVRKRREESKGVVALNQLEGDQGYNDPVLIDIVENELYPKIARTGEGNPIETEWLGPMMDRIRGLKDTGGVNRTEANNLLDQLDVLWDESMAGSDVAVRRREVREQRSREQEWMRRIERSLDNIQDDQLQGLKSKVHAFLSRPFDEDDFDELNREILNFSMPSDFSGARAEMFNYEKNYLLEILSGGAGGYRVSENERLKIAVEAIELASIVKSGSEDRYDRIDEIIASKNSNDQTYGMFIESAMENLVRNVSDKESEPIDEKLIPTIEYLLEASTERILSRADIDSKSAYPQFGFYESINLDSIIAMSRIFDHSLGRKEGGEGTSFKYLSNLRQRRQIMHELFRNMKDVETYRGYITQYLRKDGLAFVEKEIAGVPEAQMLYEKYTGSELSLRYGTLMSDDHTEIDGEVLSFMQDNQGKNIFKKTIRDDEGKIIEKRDLRDWELQRAMILGRSLFSAMQRRLVYTVSGDVPFEDIPTLIDSVESEQLARILAPMKLLGERFLGIDTTTRKLFLEELINWTKKLAKRNKTVGTEFGYKKKVNEDGKCDENGSSTITQGLYGKKESSWAILDTDISDPKSSGWKINKIFLRQKDYYTEILRNPETGRDESLPLGLYLDRLRKQIPDENEYQDKIKEVLQRQRLFLGIILQSERSHLSESNKTLIWNNVSELLPSRIAAFFPEETLKKIEDALPILKKEMEQHEVENREISPAPMRNGEIPPAPASSDISPAPSTPLQEQPSSTNNLPQTPQEMWMSIRKKLFLAESMRVVDDAQKIKGKTWDQINNLQGDDGLHNLDYYLDKVNMTVAEKQIVKDITELGKSKAEELAKIKFPHTPFLDDVPKTDYENIEDSAYDRHFVTDGNDFYQGYMAIFQLWAKPVTQVNEVVSAFDKASQSIQGPLGLKGETGAQRVLQKYISTYLSMAQENTYSKAFGPILEWIKSPRSKMEEGNLQAKIAFNEHFTSEILQGLAQHDVISDDPSEKDDFGGMTQMDKMKKDHDADGLAKLKYWLRTIFYLLGPEITRQIAYTLLPREAAEQVVAGF